VRYGSALLAALVTGERAIVTWVLAAASGRELTDGVVMVSPDPNTRR